MHVEPPRRDLRAFLIAALLISLHGLGNSSAAKATPVETPVETVVHCRVLEAMASGQFHVRLAIFHYRDAADRARLGELLRKYNGDAVQFQASDREWRAATVLRLRTCFGRGLLVFSALEPALVKGQEFVLRFPTSPVN